MYESYFSLNTKPFELLPNPDFLYLSKTHKKAVTYLEYAIMNKSGFILLTGDIGSGKTTIIRDLIRKNCHNIDFARVFNTTANFEQLLRLINQDFGLPALDAEKTVLLKELNDFLISQYAQKKQTVLIIDEAQNLKPETLEELRLLSNLETDDAKLIHIILAGQPELRQILAMPQLQQLRQRINCFCHIMPLEQNEVESYILHRLECAGNRNAVTFLPKTIDVIWTYSRGIPRLINTFCDFLLLVAFSDDKRTIDMDIVQSVLSDFDFESFYWGDSSKVTQDSGISTKTRIKKAVSSSKSSDSDPSSKKTVKRKRKVKDLPEVTLQSPPLQPAPSHAAGSTVKKKGFLSYFLSTD